MATEKKRAKFNGEVEAERQTRACNSLLLVVVVVAAKAGRGCCCRC